MLLKDDKKKAVTLIMAKMKKPEDMMEKPMPEGAEIDNSIGIESAAEEVIAAIEKKDPKMLVMALKSMMSMIEEEEPEEAEED